MKRTRLLRLLVVALLVVLAGCGTTTPDPTAATPSLETPTTSDPTATPTSPQPSSNGTLSVHYINVGQGASTLIVGPTNQTMLIDTGDWSDDGEDVLAYLQRHDIDRIDYLVTTHADADHIGGHAAIIDHYETKAGGVGAVYDPGIASSSQTYQDYLDAIEEHDVPLYQTRAGDQIPFEGVKVTVLGPPEEFLANGDRNENSVVIRLRFGGSTFLLPGDGERASEEYLVDTYDHQLDATVLSAGHHGSESSSTADFLDIVQPRIAVISSAYDSQYGHPVEAVLERLADRSIQTYWTATHGTVRVTSNGSAITVATQREAPTDPLELRDGTPIEPGTDDDLQVRTVIPLSESATTQTATPVETTESTALSVAEIHADAEGDDNENLNDEFAVFENTGDDPLEMGGWTVSDAAGHSYPFPSGFSLDPGAQVTLYTGSGSDTSTELYWGANRAVWNNGGDVITVRTEGGTIVLEEDYQ